MPKLNFNTALFSFNTFAGAMLALFIAMRIGLPRPYWAMSTAYIVSAPLSGAVRSKAVYRILGTVIGGAVAVALVPWLVDAPPLLSLVIALWVGLCLVISLLDRTPRSYLTMLSGYTAALVGFPAVVQPGTIFNTAVLRVEEIGLGILCASLTHSLIFPRAVGGALQRRLTEWLGEADRWALDLFTGRADPARAGDRTRLAAAASEIHTLSTHLPFDTSNLRDTRSAVRALHDRMLLLIPILSGIGDRMTALGQQGGLAPEARELCEAAAAWIRDGAPAERAVDLAERVRALRESAAMEDWRSLLTESLLLRLEEAVTALSEAHVLLRHLCQPERADLARAAAPIQAVAIGPRHVDLPLALRSGLTAVISILICCALWIGLGWNEGGVAAMMAAVFCCFFASFDDPAPRIANFGAYAFLSLPLAGLYLFGILPGISGFPLLAASLAPSLLFLGLYVAEPATQPKAMAFIVTFASALALQETFTADLPGFINGNLAQFVGIFVAMLVTRLIRSMGAEAAVQRLLSGTWRSLARLAVRGQRLEEASFAAQLVDRLALLSPKLGGGGARADGTGLAALGDLRIAMNLVGLQRVRPEIEGDAGARLDSVREEVGQHFAELVRTGRRPPSARLLETLDGALAPVARLGDPPSRIAIAALVGLRRNLFPQAPPFKEAPT